MPDLTDDTLDALVTARQGALSRADVHQLVDDVFNTPWLVPENDNDAARAKWERAALERKQAAYEVKIKADYADAINKLIHHVVAFDDSDPAALYLLAEDFAGLHHVWSCLMEGRPS